MNREKVIALATSPQAKQVIASLYSIYKDLPHLPAGFRDFLVKIAPWFALIGGIFGTLGGVQHILAAFGIREIELSPASDVYWLLVGVVELVGAYLIILAFPLLRDRAYEGWVLLFWNAVSAVVLSAIAVLFGLTNLIIAVLSAFIVFYIAFEVRDGYPNGMPAELEMTEEPVTEKKTPVKRKATEKPAAKTTAAPTKRATTPKKAASKKPAKSRTRKTK